jgi:hypothetical protein
MKYKFLLISILILLMAGCVSAYSQTNTLTLSSKQHIQLEAIFNASKISTIVVSVTPTVTKKSPYDLPISNLVSWYKLDEASGTNASDSGYKGCYGNAHGGVTWCSGKYNNAAYFNGEDGYIGIDSAWSLQPGTGSFTISWISSYPHAISRKYAPIISNGFTDNAANVNSFGIVASGSDNTSLKYYEIATAGTFATSQQLETSIPTGIHKFILVRDTTNHLLQFYDNGALVTNVSYNANVNLTNNLGITLGGFTGCGFHAGMMDNVLFYSNALNSSEILKLEYDPVTNLTFRTASGNSYSSNITGSAVNVSIPFSSRDKVFGSIIGVVPSNVLISGINVSDYANTIMPVNVTTSISPNTTIIPSISRAAILVDSSQLTDSNILNNYNCVRATFDYFGYKYDVLSYSTDLNTLTSYQMTVALNPTTAGLVQNYTSCTGKWALILGRPVSTLESAYHLNYDSTINTASGSHTRTIITTNPMMAVKTVVFYSTYDDYVLGSGVVSGATTSDGHKLILTYSGDNGNAVIFNSGFDQQLVRNFISLADPTAVLVTGAYPYARDLGIILRYDDVGDVPASNYTNWYKISHDCTVAAVTHTTTLADVELLKECNFVPHSYDHVALNRLSDEEMKYQAQNAKTASYNLWGKIPIGWVSPWNYYNNNTTKILYQNGYRYMLVDSGLLTTNLHNKDLQYFCNGTDTNNQLWLMGYSQQDDNNGFIQPFWTNNCKESRGYFQILLHPTGNLVTDNATRNRLADTIYNTTIHDGWFIVTADDFFTHVDDAKKVTISGNTLQVNGSTVPGLVLWQPSGTSNVALDNNTATIISRNHMAMLPALTSGTHTFTYSNNYPKISTYTNGSLINNGYYDIQNSTMYFSIHDDDEIYTRTNVSLTGLNNKTLYYIKDGDPINSFTPTNGSYTLFNLTEGSYMITPTLSIFQTIEMWINAFINIFLK